MLRLKSKLKTVKVKVMVKVVLNALWQFCGDREEPVKGYRRAIFEYG